LSLEWNSECVMEGESERPPEGTKSVWNKEWILTVRDPQGREFES